MNDLTYTYLKARKTLGYQPFFCEVAPQLLDTILPDPSLSRKYILRNPVNKEVQVGTVYSKHVVNTPVIEKKSTGINHSEGGWPKEISCNDEEAVSRFRRRVEKEENYINAVIKLAPKMRRFVKQNNAIELYQMYFTDMPQMEPVEKFIAQTKNLYRDFSDLYPNRPVSSISWTAEEDTKLVVAYANRTHPWYGSMKSFNTDLDGYVWKIDNPEVPLQAFVPPSPCWEVACSPVDHNIFVAGLEDGRVCVFDIRNKERNPSALCPVHLAHRDPVSSVVFMQTRINSEFFTGSSDGQCMFWDFRKLNYPTETVIVAPNDPRGMPVNLSHAEPVTCLQFDRNFPGRFLAGTDRGQIIYVNKKGKSSREMFPNVYNAHYGSVKAVHRSPFLSKMILSCGDWTTHIWSDEITSASIIPGLPNLHQVNDACWAPQRVSAAMTVGADGKFNFWDILRSYVKPVVSYTICRNALLKIKVHEKGRFAAVGDDTGVVHLLVFSENMAFSGENDKQKVMQTYARETYRERVIDSRVKEIKFLLHVAAESKASQPKLVAEDLAMEEVLLKKATEDYLRVVTREIAARGMPKLIPPSTKGRKKKQEPEPKKK